MKKPTNTMRCCRCNRPLLRAVALPNGQPVGPVCAVAARLVEPKTGGQQSTATRDTATLDLFPNQ